MYIRVKVIPDAKDEKVKKVKGGFVISVKEKASQNMANKRVIQLLKAIFAGKGVRLVSGHRSVSKIFDIEV